MHVGEEPRLISGSHVLPCCVRCRPSHRSESSQGGEAPSARKPMAAHTTPFILQQAVVT